MDSIIKNYLTYQDSYNLYVFCFLLSVSLCYLLFNRGGTKVFAKRSTMYILISCLIIISPVSYVLGLRNENVGFDTYNYFQSYDLLSPSLSSSISNSRNPLEVGFVFFRWLTFLFVGNDKIGAVFPMTLFTLLFLIGSFCVWKGKLNCSIGLFVFYFVLGLNMCDQARQLLSVTIVGFALYYYIQGKTKTFVGIVIAACFVHMSALIALSPLAFYSSKRKKMSNRIFSFIIIVFIGILLFVNVLYEHYISYLEPLNKNGAESSIGAALYLDVIPFVIPLLITKSKEKNIRYLRYFAYTIIVFRLIGYYSYFIMRMYYYPALVGLIVFLYDYSSEKSAKKIWKAYLTVGIAIIYFIIAYVQLQYHSVVPYESIY